MGKEAFTRELEKGAFFLMEDWVLRFEEIVAYAMGNDMAASRHLFQSEHNYFLVLRTPCSCDFAPLARDISSTYGLPLKWCDVSLDNLEMILKKTLEME
ncbi:MAG: DUF1638 domain-containing protein [bacterium]|nr:DUF1638 domain-containing protein [bacterium]